MDEFQAKRRIKELLSLQQQISLLGGIQPFSRLYRNFIMKRRILAKSFGLEPSDLVYQVMFSFPFTTAIDLSFMNCSIDMCENAYWNVYNAVGFELKHNMMPRQKNGNKVISMDQRVDMVFANLVGMTEGEYLT